FGVVELKGGNAEVEERAVERTAEVESGEVAKVTVDQLEVVPKLGGESGGARLRGGVAVEGDDLHAGRGREQRAGVAAAAKGRVEVTRAGTGGEQRERFAEQNRGVAGRHGHDGFRRRAAHGRAPVGRVERRGAGRAANAGG